MGIMTINVIMTMIFLYSYFRALKIINENNTDVITERYETNNFIL